MKKFESFYQSNDVASRYDRLRFSGAGGEYIDQLEQQFIMRNIGADFQGEILEIGCGTGRCTETLLLRGLHVTAIDPSASMLRLATERVAMLPPEVQNRAKLLIGNGLDLSGFQGRFAAAVSLRVFIHLTLPEVKNMLRQIHGKLEPGGIFCFDTLNPWSPNIVIWPINLLGSKYSKVTFHQPSKVRSVIERSGFSLLGIERHFVVPQFLLRNVEKSQSLLVNLNDRLEKLVPAISSHYFWVVRKKPSAVMK